MFNCDCSLEPTVLPRRRGTSMRSILIFLRLEGNYYTPPTNHMARNHTRAHSICQGISEKGYYLGQVIIGKPIDSLSAGIPHTASGELCCTEWGNPETLPWNKPVIEQMRKTAHSIKNSPGHESHQRVNWRDAPENCRKGQNSTVQEVFGCSGIAS